MTQPADRHRAVETYQDTRERLADFILHMPSDCLDCQVPATPKWTACQLVAHLVGVAEDVGKNNLPTAEMPFYQWTANQVARRDGASIDELLVEWDLFATTVTEIVGSEGASQAVIGDMAIHEQDLRGLAGMPGGRDTKGYRYARQMVARRFQNRSVDAGLPALTIESEGWVVRPNHEGPDAVAAASSFEMFRALSGRRSVAQMRALDWTGSPEPYLEHMPLFGPPEEDLVES